MSTEGQGIVVQENKMGVLPVDKLLLGMAAPIMISMLVQAFYNVVDSIFVSQLSENALNAVSLAFPLQNLMIAVGGGTAMGMNALLARSLGAKKQNDADRAANTGVFLALMSFVAFAVVGALGARTFFEVQTDVEEIVNYGTDYALICLCCSIGIFMQFCCERLLQATGRTSLAMWTQLIGAVINIILDPILIFGMFGMPRMEVAGAAVATVSRTDCRGGHRNHSECPAQSGDSSVAEKDPLAWADGAADIFGSGCPPSSCSASDRS